jgi:aquaporin related protein
MALKNLLPLHKKDEASQGTHPHEHHQRADGHVVQKEQKKRKQQKGFTSKWRNELVAMMAEFAGTFLFLFFAFGGTQVANTAALYNDPLTTAGQQGNSETKPPNTSVLLYISVIFGFSLMVNVWVFFRVSGGLLNPAVSSGKGQEAMGKATNFAEIWTVC